MRTKTTQVHSVVRPSRRRCGATWWSNLQPMQVARNVGYICKFCPERLLELKTQLPGSAASLAMFSAIHSCSMSTRGHKRIVQITCKHESLSRRECWRYKDTNIWKQVFSWCTNFSSAPWRNVPTIRYSGSNVFAPFSSQLGLFQLPFASATKSATLKNFSFFILFWHWANL